MNEFDAQAGNTLGFTLADNCRVGNGAMMVLNDYSQHEDRTDATDHLKDSSFKIAVVGYLVPICILGIVAINLVLGRVILPDDRFLGDTLDGLLQSYGFGWVFAGVVTMKIAAAAALFSWYALANYERTERWAQPALLASIIGLGLGLVVCAIGFFI